MIRLVILLFIIIFILEYNTRESFKNNQFYEQKYLNDPNKINNYKTKLPSINYISSDPIFQKEKIDNKILSFDPISVNIDSKFKLYGDVNLNYKESGRVYLDNRPNIDQTIDTNIKDYINKNEIHKYNDTQFKTNLNIYNSIIGLNKIDNQIINNKTIKQIYDDLTNDNRLELQQNLDDLTAFDGRDDYKINEKYGATRFDTYYI
jgi:hypothetical protein